MYGSAGVDVLDQTEDFSTLAWGDRIAEPFQFLHVDCSAIMQDEVGEVTGVDQLFVSPSRWSLHGQVLGNQRHF
jgi:hypothetical protein